jgi:hypothetical protein
MKIDVKQPLLMRIRNWDATFEKASSRAVDRCSYVCVPNKQDSMGLMNVVELHDGMTIFGCYNMLLRLCSRQRRPDAKKEPEAAAIYWRDGWLTESGKKDGRRYSLQSLARNFRRPLEEIVRMVLVCSGEEVGWLEILEGDETYSLELEDGRKHSITITGTSASHAAAMPEPSASHEPAISEPSTGLKQSADSQPAASHEPGIDIRKEGRAGIEGRERTEGRVLSEESEEKAESRNEKAESRIATSLKKSDNGSVRRVDGGIAVSPPRRHRGDESAAATPDLEPGECNQGLQGTGPCEPGELIRLEIGMDEAKDRLTAIAKGKRFTKFLRAPHWPYELQEALSRDGAERVASRARKKKGGAGGLAGDLPAGIPSGGDVAEIVLGIDPGGARGTALAALQVVRSES